MPGNDPSCPTLTLSSASSPAGSRASVSSHTEPADIPLRRRAACSTQRRTVSQAQPAATQALLPCARQGPRRGHPSAATEGAVACAVAWGLAVPSPAIAPMLLRLSSLLLGEHHTYLPTYLPAVNSARYAGGGVCTHTHICSLQVWAIASCEVGGAQRTP